MSGLGTLYLGYGFYGQTPTLCVASARARWNRREPCLDGRTTLPDSGGGQRPPRAGRRPEVELEGRAGWFHARQANLSRFIVTVGMIGTGAGGPLLSLPCADEAVMGKNRLFRWSPSSHLCERKCTAARPSWVTRRHDRHRIY